MGRHLLAYLAPNLALALSSFGMVAILTRLLSDDAYGRYTLVYAAMTLAQYISVVWIEAAAARFYAEAAEKGEKPAHFATLLKLFSWCAGGFALVSIAALLLWPADVNLKIVIAIAFGSVITRSLIKIALETRRMAQEATRYAVVETLHIGLGFGLGISAVILFAMGPEGPFIGMLIASLIVLLIEGPALFLAARAGAFQPERARAYLAYGAPLAGGLILSLALTSGDRFVIAAFLGEGDVGAYSAGYQVGARILDIIFTWGAAAVTPILIAAYERGGPAAAVKAAHQGYVVRLGIGAPAALGLGLLAAPICEFLIGEALRDRAVQIVPWIAFSALLAGMCDYFSEAFMLSKKALQRAILLLVPVITNLGLNVMLLPSFGLMGAAYANVASYGVGMMMLAIVGRRYVALPIPLDQTLKIALACGGMAGVVLAVPSIGPLPDLIIKSAVGGLSYGVFVILLDVAGARSFARSLWARWARRHVA
ncbi:hypothetical protein PbB2_01252 [Candidatus Phycosocius bacilliformis]|uniref:Uncharacterized protein n=1 Tax=Candidatus Phycosocius bacilliformis TaxID=1445552 RepID=A0A2P2E986_9PROT|nr:lipopolysaccharide biosynthesis protein [Candidatus Phycosocius bacilliformis]GBF57584.1 hypothetical protein PbB2_01252 [Candidatus Phycosocius bacilliformis]